MISCPACGCQLYSYDHLRTHQEWHERNEERIRQLENRIAFMEPAEDE
jgi:hypothetical protein